MARATLAIGGLRVCSVAKSVSGGAHGQSLSQPNLSLTDGASSEIDPLVQSLGDEAKHLENRFPSNIVVVLCGDQM
jgi:hypothetical protein